MANRLVFTVLHILRLEMQLSGDELIISSCDELRGFRDLMLALVFLLFFCSNYLANLGFGYVDVLIYVFPFCG